MKSEDFLKHLLDELRALPSETEWCEFKVSNCKPQEIGEYISALSNSACLHEKDHAYLVFGIETGTHVIKGQNFSHEKKKLVMKNSKTGLLHSSIHELISRLSSLNMKIFLSFLLK